MRRKTQTQVEIDGAPDFEAKRAVKASLTRTWRRSASAARL